ncbi:MAG: class I SAM-dependent methyltransferase [Planctomycetaceae bacterium]|nr:class I SAM-dependent methyltransferase [Planctomycetaceae bacterium]
MEQSNCYDFPQYWDLAFGEDTKLEADFVEAAVRRYCSFSLSRVYEPGCGGGRLVMELARRGYDVTGCDLSGPSIAWLQQQLKAERLSAAVSVADMRDPVPAASLHDAAYCFVNTFRHLLTEEDAVRHLRSVASMLRPGGLYLLGIHLLPPDADEEDEEAWQVTADDTTVDMQLVVADCCRESRLETLRFTMSVRHDAQKDQPNVFRSDYRMRLYDASQIASLFATVEELRLLDVYDFWYDMTEPLALNDELADAVFVLQRV